MITASHVGILALVIAPLPATIGCGRTGFEVITSLAGPDGAATSGDPGRVQGDGVRPSGEESADGGGDSSGADGGDPAGGGDASGTWWNNNWARRIRISFDNAAGLEDLVDFPVLVILSPAEIDYSRVRDAGQDVRFVDEDDSTVLPHEIEVWNETGDSILWVRVPRIDAGSTNDFVWLYFDNSSAADGQSREAVWSNGFVGVWHLSESPLNGGAFFDSTANALHGTFVDVDGSSTTAAAGRIGGGLRLAADKDYIDLGDPPPLRITGSMTVEVWIEPDGFGTDWPKIINKLGSSPARSYRLEIEDASRLPVFSLSPDGIAVEPMRRAATPLTTSAFTHVVGVYDAGVPALDIYVNGAPDNGVLQGSVTSSQYADNGKPVYIGGREDGGDNEAVHGTIDEVRISNVPRSAGWVAAQHASMTGTFVSLSAFEVAP